MDNNGLWRKMWYGTVLKWRWENPQRYVLIMSPCDNQIWYYGLSYECRLLIVEVCTALVRFMPHYALWPILSGQLTNVWGLLFCLPHIAKGLFAIENKLKNNKKFLIHICILMISCTMYFKSWRKRDRCVVIFVFLKTLIVICNFTWYYSASGNIVTIGGTECTIQSESETQIICRTGAHTPSEKTKVRVEVGNNGIAIQVGLHICKD